MHFFLPVLIGHFVQGNIQNMTRKDKHTVNGKNGLPVHLHVPLQDFCQTGVNIIHIINPVLSFQTLVGTAKNNLGLLKFLTTRVFLGMTYFLPLPFFTNYFLLLLCCFYK